MIGQTPLQPIIGKRVILFPLVPADLENFIKLHRDDKNGFMCRFSLKNMTEDEAIKYVFVLLTTAQILAFSVMTKEGKASRVAGYVYLSDITKYSASVSGILDKEFARGLSKQLKHGKRTYSQDALHTTLGFCFDTLGLSRVEADALEHNRIIIPLLNAEGFAKEGVLRNALLTDDGLKNVVIFSLLKEEWDNGKDKEG